MFFYKSIDTSHTLLVSLDETSTIVVLENRKMRLLSVNNIVAMCVNLFEKRNNYIIWISDYAVSLGVICTE